jgi:hypothetical protein
MTCSGCGEAARCVGLRDKQVLSLLGTLKLCRHYYHCQQCRQGCCPWEQMLRIADQRLTPAAREVVCLTGIQESFGQAAGRTLHKLTGLRLSESSVERMTEAAGTFLTEQQAQGLLLGESNPYDWNRDTQGVGCA